MPQCIVADTGAVMSVMCFVCNLPILSHQISRTWEQPGDERGFCHDDCLRCDTCGLGLSGANLTKAKRCQNKLLCDIHYSDVTAVEGNDFLQKLREFKGQSLGYAVARRKSSTTLVFPIPPQACQENLCPFYPHGVKPTPGYWIECRHSKPPSSSANTADGSSNVTNSTSSANPSVSVTSEDNVPLPTVEETFKKHGSFELASFEQETYEKYFYGTEHWNYFCNDDDLGPVIFSLKQETSCNRDQFR